MTHESDFFRQQEIKLAISLKFCLPIRMLHYQRQGGTSEDDWAKLPLIADTLAACGTSLIWRNADGVSTSAVFAELLDALAIASVAPIGSSSQDQSIAEFRQAQISRWLDELEGGDRP